MKTQEILEIDGRKFHIIPENPSDKDTAWTFLEEVRGAMIEPTDIMGCSAPKHFVAHHIRSSLPKRTQ